MPSPVLPSLPEQAQRLISLGIHEAAGLPENSLREAAANLEAGGPGGLLVLDPVIAPPSVLTPKLDRGGKPGFVVADMTDVDDFHAIDEVDIPRSPTYSVHGLDRGDAMLNWTPNEALPEILKAGRTPLTISEGIFWLLQQPAALEPGRCFMTTGSRLRRPDGRLDSRTPALWISGGTGRDGAVNRGAPKLGWCWAGNRHTWLGIASASSRRA